jgi:hypothetical protein
MHAGIQKRCSDLTYKEKKGTIIKDGLFHLGATATGHFGAYIQVSPLQAELNTFSCRPEEAPSAAAVAT